MVKIMFVISSERGGQSTVLSVRGRFKFIYRQRYPSKWQSSVILGHNLKHILVRPEQIPISISILDVAKILCEPVIPKLQYH